MSNTAQKANSTVRFQNTIGAEFAKTLNQRVNNYFKNIKNGRFGNTRMVVKTIVMCSLFFVPYFLNVFLVEQFWILCINYIIMGIGMAGIGLSVMHDANHGSYSRNKWVNKFLGYTMNMLGGNATNWKIQHNVLHHTYTNIDGLDMDIDSRFILRFSPYAKKMKIHKYQHIYAWFLYGLMTFSWILSDFFQFLSFQKRGLVEQQHVPAWRGWLWLTFTKTTYISYFVVVPLLFTSFVWWQILIGIVITHYVAGFILAVIFQLAHVMDVNEYPQADEQSGVVEDNWMIHQLKTTCNFAKKDKLLSWYIGGLNYQIEHHLFPNICHVHYKKLSDIVEKTAKEFNVPYNSFTTMRSAMKNHFNMLHTLGR